MNYRHSFHAGNFADVVKHVALAALLLHLKKKQTPFVVIDTHAGRGLYDLAAPETVRTGESAAGIGRLLSLGDGPQVVAAYLDLVRGLGGGFYPGSPLIAARLKRPQDRLVAIEKQPDEAAALKQSLRPFARARAIEGDGYAELAGLLPPPERRGIILIDPSFERASEFADAARAVGRARERFAIGIFLVWFPLKAMGEADAFCDEVAGQRALKIEFDTAPKLSSSGDGKLHAAGILVINPPFGLEGEMRAALEVLEPLLGHAEGTRARSRISALPRAGRQMPN